MDNIKLNKKLKKILITICILSFIDVSTSYASVVENFNFKNITIEDGLSQATVKTIFQDSKGYIWIGTWNKRNQKQSRCKRYRCCNETEKCL